MSNLHGLLLIDKPINLSSHDVIKKLRKILKQKKIGHTGTLDPIATGMLAIVLGDATRFSNNIVQQKKCYTATIKLGQQTSTDDKEGQIIRESAVPIFSLDEIKKTLQEFTGQITQQVPDYSAIHVDGQRLYKLARSNKEFTAPKRDVIVHNLILKDYDNQCHINIACTVSSGTYIRALARDIGQKLGCYGHIIELRREWIHPYEGFKMLTIDSDEAKLRENIIDINHILDNIETVHLDYLQALQLARGQILSSQLSNNKMIAIKYKNNLLGLGRIENNQIITIRLRPSPIDYIMSL